MSTARKTAAAPTLEFSDNALMARLAGPGEKNFVRIEQKLGVRLSLRGNLVAVEGKAREHAAKVLRRLYARLDAGEDLHLADVDAEIRFAAETEISPATGVAFFKTASGKTEIGRAHV